MTEIVGIKFRDVGKTYYFSPAGKRYEIGDEVVIETQKGIEYGYVTLANTKVKDEDVTQPLRSVLRKATDFDRKTKNNNLEREEKAFDIAVEKIKKHGLDMKLVRVEYAFDGSKITFYFSADERVDFRELVKDLAFVFKRRIELRQIGDRDRTKLLGGLGMCGRPFCCKTFVGDFQPVKLEMAKSQGLSLSPGKISGACGRLMCCLKYEQDGYDYLWKTTPKVGTKGKTKEVSGTVVSVNILTGDLRIKPEGDPDAQIVVINRDDLK